MEANTINTSGLQVDGGHTPLVTPVAKVKIAYADGYDGPRFMPEGSVQEVAPDTAEHFIALGIATAVEEGEEAADTKETSKAKGAKK